MARLGSPVTWGTVTVASVLITVRHVNLSKVVISEARVTRSLQAGQMAGSDLSKESVEEPISVHYCLEKYPRPRGH